MGLARSLLGWGYRGWGTGEVGGGGGVWAEQHGRSGCCIHFACQSRPKHASRHERTVRAPVPPAALYPKRGPAAEPYLRRLAELPAGLVQRVGAHCGRLLCILLGNSAAQHARACHVIGHAAVKRWKAATFVVHAAACPMGRRDRRTACRQSDAMWQRVRGISFCKQLLNMGPTSLRRSLRKSVVDRSQQGETHR